MSEHRRAALRNAQLLEKTLEAERAGSSSPPANGADVRAQVAVLAKYYKCHAITLSDRLKALLGPTGLRGLVEAGHVPHKDVLDIAETTLEHVR
jgi:hypothetical protein